MGFGYSVVVDDMRFPNGAEALRGLSVPVELWRIKRADAPACDQHESEGQLDGLMFDQTIINNGTLEDLHASLAQKEAYRYGATRKESE